jgi:gamma-glutamyl-gamma-aminobutyraldehyde dehydrogenase/4-guanidinobutyraldehyde dehydrogenase/NAD-dependent aldehyde dehydrogenase
MALNYEEVIKVKNSLSFKNQAFINGKYVNSISGKVFENYSPVDGALVTSVAECDIEDINDAVKAARSVFEKGSWSRMAPNKRKKYCLS